MKLLKQSKILKSSCHIFNSVKSGSDKILGKMKEGTELIYIKKN